MLSTTTKTCRVIALHVAPAQRKEIKRQKKNQVHCSLIGRKKRGKQATKVSSICICRKSVQKKKTIWHRFNHLNSRRWLSDLRLHRARRLRTSTKTGCCSRSCTKRSLYGRPVRGPWVEAKRRRKRSIKRRNRPKTRKSTH